MATTVPAGVSDPRSVRYGGFAGWPLPPDETGARFARHLVRAVLGELGCPDTLVYDAAVALSELATNVHVHAYGRRPAPPRPAVASLPEPEPEAHAHAADPPVAGLPKPQAYAQWRAGAGLPELWAYARWCPRPEVVFKVYDSALWRGPVTPASRRSSPPQFPSSPPGPAPHVPGRVPNAPGSAPHVPGPVLDAPGSAPYEPDAPLASGPAPYEPGSAPYALRPAPYAEGGRGFEVVDAIATEYDGEWGVHRTISRFGAAPVPGKAVYVTVPAPAEALVAVRATVRQLAEEIRGLLAERGIRRVQMSADREMAVICVRAGMHVWIRDGSLSSCVPGVDRLRHPPSDRIDVVERLVRHSADLDAASHA